MTAPDAHDPQSERPGRIMCREMAEQPEALRRLLDEGAPLIHGTADRVAAQRPRFVLLTGRGTSDHAALYAKYLLEVRLGLPCGLTSMSTVTAYGARPDLRDVLAVTVSQSGGSPDLVASTRAAREAGAITVAVTNNPDSPLAAVAEHHIDILAGPERAPATKSYTSALLALYLFIERLGERLREGSEEGLREGPEEGPEEGAEEDDRSPSLSPPSPSPSSPAAPLPALAAGLLARQDEIKALAARYRFADRMVLTSRGYGYPTAMEAALKLMETSYISALAYSGADLLHGPLAMVDNISPVIAVVPDGRGGEALGPVLERLRGRGADLVVVGPKAQVEQASAGFVLPTDGVPEELQPILEIIPLQLLAYEVTIARGHDPDAPRALAKVTETR
ncbi:SIS domain-containing protein [Streptomyces sp. NPDC002564]|uniref:SIS domain-containing protein n=1 Tax=Streptomyces sp. NPDC002564 TaxID=3364649 RepID=UPI0036D18BE1